ncbi:helix-turn-helix domain-containing protein [Acrocarpospora sp. B8E8]|uniref:helix-turn-helix domain-containing protein n=1 Tax=Acrocarpospora sp. B8E8 TaxID=3153572 RepID=UPI00325D6068
MTEPVPADVEFLKPAEIATKLRVAKMSVYRLIHSGELPAIKVGKSFRVPVAAYEAYVAAAAVEGEPSDG